MIESRTPAAPARLMFIAAFAAVYLIWGSTYLAIRFAIETLPSFLMAGVRFLVAGGLLYAWARWRGAARPDLGHWKTSAIVGGLLLLMGNGGVVMAEHTLSSSLTALLIATMPLWMAGLDWLHRGERPNGGVMVGLLGGFLGVALLVGPGDLAEGGSVDPFGAGLVLLASLSWASGSLYARRARLPEAPLLATGMQMIAGGVLLLVAGSLTGEWGQLDPAALSGRSLLALAYLIVFGSLVGFTAYVWLLRVTTPARVSTYAYVNPVVAVILGWALAGEALTSRMMVAAAVIVGAVAIMTTYRSRPGSSGGGDRPGRGAPEPESIAAAERSSSRGLERCA